MIVGVAYVENSTPRSVSKRSTDLISPMVPTWTRSSSGSPRLRKRRAQCSTSGRCRCTNASRAAVRLPSGDSASPRTTKSSALRRRVSSTPVGTSGSVSSSVVETIMSEAGLGMTRFHGQRDRERRVLGGGRRAGRERGEDLPREAVVVGRDVAVHGDGDADGQGGGPHEEPAGEVGARGRL